MTSNLSIKDGFKIYFLASLCVEGMLLSSRLILSATDCRDPIHSVEDFLWGEVKMFYIFTMQNTHTNRHWTQALKFNYYDTILLVKSAFYWQFKSINSLSSL